MNSIDILTPELQDYSLLDSGGGERLERFGKIIVRKPDPQAIWKKQTKKWDDATLIFHKDQAGFWEKKGNVPDKWLFTWKSLSFIVHPTPFKHLGIFPEQATHWEWIQKKIKTAQASEASGRKLKILNLFAYTGTMSVVCAYEGCDVTHVDASKSA